MRTCDNCRHRSVSRGPGCPWCGRRTGAELVLVDHQADGSWWGRLVERVLDRLTEWIDRLGNPPRHRAARA